LFNVYVCFHHAIILEVKVFPLHIMLPHTKPSQSFNARSEFFISDFNLKFLERS
jgi:hypothetical protein